MGKILKRFIYGYIALVVAMLVGLAVQTVHHVIGTQINERNTKKLVCEFIVALQESDYATLSSMIIFEDGKMTSENNVKEYVEKLEFDKLKNIDLQAEKDFIRAYNRGEKCNVRLSYDHIDYGFNCIKTDEGWKIESLNHEYF